MTTANARAEPGICRFIPRLPAALLRLSWIFLLIVAQVVLADSPQAALAPPQQTNVEVFVREGCPHCAKAKLFLGDVVRKRPDLQISYRSLDREPQARADLARYCRAAGVWPPGVPTFVVDGRMMVGFDSAEASGPLLLGLIEQSALPADRIESGWFGTISAERLGLPLFTLAMGLLDGFNPCAMWVLLFLLSLLIRLQDRRRMAVIAGVFVFASGAIYYAFMAAWLNIFLLLEMSAVVRLTLACTALLVGVINIRDALRVGSAATLSIPASAKPGLYARIRRVLQADALATSLVSVVMLAVAVNFFELLCTAGLPAIYTAVLTQHHLDAWRYYAYLALYNLAYIADDILMVVLAVAALSNRRLTGYGGQRLKLLSGLVMLVLGGVMLLRPEWLW